jgi:hypothetical protein
VRVRVEVPSRSGLMFPLSPQRHGTLNIADKVSATVPEIAVASATHSLIAEQPTASYGLGWDNRSIAKSTALLVIQQFAINTLELKRRKLPMHRLLVRSASKQYYACACRYRSGGHCS